MKGVYMMSQVARSFMTMKTNLNVATLGRSDIPFQTNDPLHYDNIAFFKAHGVYAKCIDFSSIVNLIILLMLIVSSVCQVFNFYR